jgi:hypothetical protein
MKNQSKKDFIHTGDVQAVESNLPKGAKVIDKKPVAYGEKSGHLHVITGDYEMFEDENQGVFVKVGPGGAWSQHVHESIWKNAGFDTQEQLQKADHKPARLLPNKVYKVAIHQAYDPYQKIKQKVID